MKKKRNDCPEMCNSFVWLMILAFVVWAVIHGNESQLVGT